VSEHSASPLRSVRLHQLRQWLALAAILASLGTILAGGLYREYRAVRDTEIDRLRAQVRAIDLNLGRQIEAADASLLRFMEDLPRWRQGEGFDEEAARRLVALEEALPGIRTFVVVDAPGYVRVSNRPELVGADVLKRDFYHTAKAATDPATLIVSEPFRSVLGIYAMNLVRVIRGPDGKFDGLVAAALDPSYFSTLLASVLYAPDMLSVVIHGKGKLFLIEPHDANRAGTDLAQPGSFFAQHIASGRDENVYEGMARLSGEMRINVQRTVGSTRTPLDQPLVVSVSRNRAQIFAGWRESLELQAGVFLVFALGSVMGLVVWQRAMQRQLEERESARRELEFSHRRYEQMAKTVPCVLFEYEQDADGGDRFAYISARCEDLLELPQSALLADTSAAWQLAHPEDRERLRHELANAVHAGDWFHAETRFVLPSGRLKWIEISSRVKPGSPGEPVRWSGFMLDITARKTAEEEMRRLATTDTLTGVANRGSFLARCAQELDRVRRFGQPAAFLMLDIDHFKRVNDSRGHAAGDEVLRHLAQIAADSLRSIDLFGRLGGEEFGVLLPGTDAPGAMEFAERLRALVEASPASTAHGDVAVTVSIGAAQLRAEDPDPEAAMARADAALYEAKHSGRNRVVQHD